MTIRREKKTLVIDWGKNIDELKLYDRQVKYCNVFHLPTTKRTAYVYGFNVFSELVTARQLAHIKDAINALKKEGYAVYVSSQANTIFKRFSDIKRFEYERYGIILPKGYKNG